MKKLSFKQKYFLSEIGAYLIGAGAPLTTAFVMFPPEVVESTSMSLGLGIIVAGIVALMTLRKKLATLFDGNKGLFTAWAVITIFALLMRYVGDQLLIIGIVGCVASAGTTPLLNYGEKQKGLADMLKEAENKAEVEKAMGGK